MQRNIKAMELFTSSVCNLDCKYCYIPKSKTMVDIQRALEKRFPQSFSYSALGDYRKHLEFLGFWGAEQTVIMDKLLPMIEQLPKYFPKLKQLAFSTNGIKLVEIQKFIEKCNDIGVDVEIQFSVDGPEYINGMNRMPNILKTVLGNIEKLILWLNEKDLNINVSIRTKGTLTIENVKFLLKHKLVEDFANFFREYSKYFSEIVKNKRVRFLSPMSFNTEVPGEYTKEDGILFAEFLRELHSVGFDSAFTGRLKRIIDFRYSIPRVPSMFTCSGGDSNWGYDFENIHICHRTFMLDNDDYISDILANKKDNWDVKNLARGTVNQVSKYFIMSPKRWLEFQYKTAAYHDFWRLKIANTIIEIKELAYAGLISEIYKENDSFAELFALFLNIANSCPAENLMVCGSLFLVPPSIIKLWGNGAFYELVRHTIGR